MSKPGFIHYLMISPVQLLLVGFILLPSVYVAWLSLQQSTFGQDPVFVGLQNYIFIFTDPVFWRAFWNTFWVVNVVVYGELLLGIGLALLLAGWMPGKRTIIAVLLAPYAITEVTAVVMWRYMLEPDVGLINYLLMQWHLPQIEWSINPLHALAVVALLSIWLHLPFTFLILYAAVTAIPRELIEASVVDGASPWQTFWHVKLRVIMPAILVALMFRYIIAMRLFSELWLLTEGGPARLTEVLAVYLYRYAFRYHEFGVAAATGLAMLLLSLLIALPYLYQMYRQMFRHA
jgi:multiple sugar transport system permease protein